MCKSFPEQLIQRLGIRAVCHPEAQLAVVERVLVQAARQLLPIVGLIEQIDADIGREQLLKKSSNSSRTSISSIKLSSPVSNTQGVEAES